MEKCWVIFEGRYYSDTPNITAIFKTKKEAEKDCRNRGYKFNKRQDLFLNDDLQWYRSLEYHKILLRA